MGRIASRSGQGDWEMVWFSCPAELAEQMVPKGSVAVDGVTRSAEAGNLPCTAADFTVTQYSGPYPLAVPPGTSSLSGLGVPAAAWPQVGMLDTSANQDGCKGATLQLSYSGSGQGN